MEEIITQHVHYTACGFTQFTVQFTCLMFSHSPFTLAGCTRYHNIYETSFDLPVIGPIGLSVVIV